jgi:hypothetical protein
MAKKQFPTITVNRLHEMLADLIREGHGKTPVCVSKSTFTHNCEEDGITILPVNGCVVKHILMDDGDGGTKYRKDGSECRQKTAILFGDSGTAETC